MMNDTVREELETKIGRPPLRTEPEIPTEELELSLESIPEFTEPEPVEAIIPDPLPPPAPLRPKAITAELKGKETSPTLIDFQHKSPAVPDWRLQLQNSIRKRSANGSVDAGAPVTAAAMQANPQAAPSVSAPKPTATVQIPRNEKIANALKRIEESRRTYSAHGIAVAAARKASPKATVANRTFPFDVVERAPAVPKREAPTSAPVESSKPKLVSPLRIEKRKFDTNKLPPIPEPETSLPAQAPVESPAIIEKAKPELHFERLSFRNKEERVETVEHEEEQYDEIDDLAPLSMRFGAAVFDLIIGGFAAGILLSPFLVSNADLATVSGFLAIGGAVLLVMFVYQTLTTAFMGRTFGMKLFSIEIIDAEKNENPTLHQAAVNSAVYLLSLLFFGIGFLPAFFNEERRTVHDILSGTLLIREY
jgi:uncharacterized RDD family membrane protein YckC